MGTKVLVIDDVADMRKLESALLKSIGVEFTTCSSGHEAIELIREDPSFNLALLDVNLEDISGFEIIKFIRKNSPETKICFVTGLRNAEDVKKGVQLGASDYVVKPIEPKIFLHKVKKLLGMDSSDSEQQHFRFLDVEIKGILEDLPFDAPLKLEKISEIQAVFTVNIPVNKGSTIRFSCETLSKLFGEKIVLQVKALNVKSEDSKSMVTAEWVGVPEKFQQILRSLIIRGFKIIDA